MFKSLLSFIVVLAFIGCSSHTSITHKLDPKSKYDYTYYDMQSATYKNDKQLVKKLSHYRVIFIGDHHDQDDLHQKVASLVEALAQHHKKLYFAAEWFTPQDNETLLQYMESKLTDEAFTKAINWSKRVGYKFDSFKPIYKALQKYDAKLVGINLTKAERSKISKKELQSMRQDEKTFFRGLDLDVSPHQSLVKPYFDHCHKVPNGSEDCDQRMYRVQVAWDSKMADEAFKVFKRLKNDEVLVVFAGAMHFMKGLGINLRFARVSDEPFITLLPLSKDAVSIEHGVADGMILYQANKGQKVQ